MIEHDRYHIDGSYRDALTAAGLGSASAILSAYGDRLVAWSRSSDTIFVSLPGNLSVYIKRYHFSRMSQRLRVALRGTLVRPSRSRAEYRILSAMRRHGVQAVRPIAWGERRLYGFVRSSFLITEAVPETMALSTFIRTFGRREASTQPIDALRARRDILTSLALQVRTMHDAGFVHRDLFWRNVLIRPLPNREWEFYFLDASVGRRIRVRQWRRESIVRDLAAMAVLAPDFCSRADQLRFIRAYLGTETIDDEGRQWMQLVQDCSVRLRESELQRLDRQSVFDQLGPRPAEVA